MKRIRQQYRFGATRNPQELGSPMSSARYGRCYQFLLSSAWESLTFEQLPWFLYDSSAGLGLVAPKSCQNHLMWRLTRVLHANPKIKRHSGASDLFGVRAFAG